jgi:hypothetical protein
MPNKKQQNRKQKKTPKVHKLLVTIPFDKDNNIDWIAERLEIVIRNPHLMHLEFNGQFTTVEVIK